jgi:hypothetical protein
MAILKSRVLQLRYGNIPDAYQKKQLLEEKIKAQR